MRTNIYRLWQLSILDEQRKQANRSFTLALVVGGISAVISFVGISLLLTGKAPEGLVVAATGLLTNVVSASCFRFANDMNTRLEKMASVIEDRHR
jgi:hypothetical protein